ncbi:hypothetical protein ILUMI_06423 [Ignelater luminosus]|uniref:Uncharacterized protein n=1 Tax=Ignelater luminosus TaxID=2038154 RepID=A0A8K0DAQ7_IGNLU|nr:hypothetical protein ILUMI_06423 [Ignelater luminosus]
MKKGSNEAISVLVPPKADTEKEESGRGGEVAHDNRGLPRCLTPPLQSRSGTAGLLPLSSAQARSQGKPMQLRRRRPRGRDGISEGDPGKQVPEGVRAVGIALYALCRSTRVLFRGLLRICTD